MLENSDILIIFLLLSSCNSFQYHFSRQDDFGHTIYYRMSDNTVQRPFQIDFTHYVKQEHQ